MSLPTPEVVRLLLVEDDPLDRELIRRMLRRLGERRFELSEVDSLHGARLFLTENEPDCVLLDYRLPDGDGLELLRELPRIEGRTDLPVILMTGLCSQSVQAEARAAGAWQALEKGSFDASALDRLMSAALGGEPPTL